VSIIVDIHDKSRAATRSAWEDAGLSTRAWHSSKHCQSCWWQV